MKKSIDEALDELQSSSAAQEQQQLAGGARMSLDVKHDKRARAEALAGVLGEQDVDFVERNFDYLESTSRARGLYQSLPEESVARQQLRDPQSPGYDDVESIAKVEGGLVGMARDVKASLPKGRDVYAGGNEAFNLMISGADDQLYGERMAGYNERMNRQSDAGLNWFQKIPGDTAEMVGLYTAMLPEMSKAALAAGAGGALATGGLAAIPSALFGFKIGSAKEMFQVEAGWAFDEFRALKDESGNVIDRDMAMGAALMAGGINAGLEFVGFNAALLNTWGVNGLVKGLGKGGVKALLRNPMARDSFAKIAKDYAAGVVGEGTTEALQELTLIGFDMLLTGTVGNVEEYAGRVIDSFETAFRGAIGLGAPGVVARGTSVALDNNQMKQRQKAFQALGEDVKTSKLFSRAPKQFQEFIKQVQEKHGLVDTVYVENEAAATYFQEIDPEQLARDMPETARSLAEAQDTGGYVAIPLDEFVTYVAPNMGDLYQDITFDPLTPTAREMEAAESQAAELMKQYEEAQGQIDAAEDPVYGRVFVELLGAGRKADVAEREAMLFTTMINRMAQRQGMDPLDYYRSKKISIRGELIQQDQIDAPTYTGGLINLLREGRGPSQRDAFGQSLVEYLLDIGLSDEGGELAARDLDKQLPGYGRRRLSRDNGITLSEAFERARDAGYLDDVEKMGEDNALLAAIDREITGSPVYAADQLSPQMLDLKDALDNLDEMISRAGFDIHTMTNEEIMDRLGITELQQDPGGEILYQLYDGPRLSALHNLSTENLIFADEMGGIAVPSLAVLKEDMAHGGYGEITLIGTEELGNPEKVTVYDSDAYTSTFPHPEYPKAKSAVAQKMVDEIRDWVQKYEGRRGYVIDATWDYAVNNAQPDKIIQEWMRSSGVKAMFLKEQGAAETRVAMQDVPVRHPETGHPAVVAFFKSLADGEWREASGDANDQLRKALAVPYRQALEETYSGLPEKLRQDMLERNIDEEGAVRFGIADALYSDQAKLGQRQVNESETSKRLDKKLKGKEAEFQSWVHSKVLSLFGEPFLKVNRRKVPYTLDNIVEYMTDGGTQAKEAGLTFGEGKARATAAKKFTELQTMRNYADWQIVPEEEVSAAREKAQELMEAYRMAALEYYQGRDWRGEVDTWNGLDDAMKAIAYWATNRQRMGNEKAMRQGFSRNDFKGVPNEVIQQGIKAGEAMMEAPLPYFEAKPERVVRLDEFAGAVIPKKVDPRVLEILDKHGIPYVKAGAKYDDAARGPAVIKLRNKLDKQGKRVLFQDSYKQNALGYLEITPQRLTITLTKSANLSTFIHESGHLFLELMREAATQPDAPVDLLQDWETIKAYLGSDGEFTTEQHEIFARSFEAYLFEGKAPSQELVGLFSRFKSWLLAVYRTIKKLDVELNDEIRAVFDRMLVAEDAVQEVSGDIVAAFDPGSGLPDAEYQALVRLQEEAIQAGQDDMASQTLAEVRRMRTEAYRERKKSLTDQITREVDADPVYAVQRLLRTGNDENMTVPPEMVGRKMSSQAVTNQFADSKILRKIPGLTKKVGLHPDVFADLYGFESGYHMIQKIIVAPPRSKVISERVQAALDDEFGNMAQDTETVERAAMALHNRKMETFLIAEARAINRKLGRKDSTTLNHATKDAARRHIAALPLRRIRPYAYYQAEMKAARAAQEAVAAGKFEEAAKLKQQQLLNHHLYREAGQAVDRAEVIRGKLKKFESPRAMARIRKGDPLAANAIDALLSGVELKRTAIKQIDARRKLAEYVQAMADKGEPATVDPQLYQGAELVNWREMTLEQLEQLDSSVQALAKQGRDADKIRVAGELVEMAQAIEDLDSVASANLTRKEIDRYSVDHRSPLTRTFTSFMASLRKIEFECRFADGDITGKWHRTIFQPFVDAQNAKTEMLDSTVGELKEIMGSITREDATRLDQEINFLGATMKRGDLYVVALNMGNQGNWDRLFSRRWKGQERQVMQRIQEELTLEDFRRVEALGQMVDKFYEPMASVSERVDGIRPPKVEAKPLFLDKYGVELSGWYYPVKYQDAVGTREQSVLEESNSIDMGPSPITGQVSKSMTKDRMAGAGGVLSLDLSGLPQHLHQVVHYVTHYEAVRNFDKLRRRSEFRSMYESYFDQDGYKQLRSWLQNIATNGTIAQTSHDASKTMDAIFRRARYGGSLIGLGWKVSSALMQALGTGPAAKEVGAVRMSRWLLQLSYGRLTTAGRARVHPAYQAALDASPELKHLDSQIDRDIREFTDQAIRVMRRKPGIAQAQWVMDQAYYMIIAVQKHINAATWLAAHEKAQEEGRSVPESVQYADATVRQTQSGGGLKDLAGLQQGNELTKLVTLFYTYFSVQHNQLRLTGRQDLLRGFWQGQGPHGRLKSLGKFAAANFFIVIAPALVEALLKHDEDDDDEMLPYLAKRIASTYVAGLPVIRDVYSAATRNFSAPSTPLDQVVQSLVKGLDSSYELVSLEGNWTDWRNVSKAATLITWLPFYQVYSYTEALAASDEFGDAVGNVMFGTPYSERRELDD